MLAEEGDDLSKVEVPKASGAPKAAAAPAKEEKKETPGEFLHTDDFGVMQKFGSNGTVEHSRSGQLE